MRMPPTLGLVSLLLATATATTTAQERAPADATLRIPAFTGYAYPDPEALRRNDDGSVRRCDGTLLFYVDFAATGAFTLRRERSADAPANAATTLVIVHPVGAADAAKHTTTTDELGTWTVQAPGPHLLHISNTNGDPLRHLAALHLTGPAVARAHTNTAERRNAASVHLGYPVPRAHRDDVAWFYVELTPRTDPLHTYYMATGWHRGYFGMQVNSATERRLIFSVWDAGTEAIDRGRVAAADRVSLVQKGDRVHAGDFGNEGTGGHSHLVHDWKLGDTFRFLLHARVDGDATIYSGWFWFAAARRWGLIASFRAPKDGKLPRGLYSFSENFAGSTGDRRRECEFGNAWIRTTGGEWLPLLRAHFTHDETGEHVRRDRWAGVRDGRFFLCHGDFTPPPPESAMKARAELVLPAANGKPPTDDELPPLPR